MKIKVELFDIEGNPVKSIEVPFDHIADYGAIKDEDKIYTFVAQNGISNKVWFQEVHVTDWETLPKTIEELDEEIEAEHDNRGK